MQQWSYAKRRQKVTRPGDERAGLETTRGG
jgi:hypothetical protein